MRVESSLIVAELDRGNSEDSREDPIHSEPRTPFRSAEYRFLGVKDDIPLWAARRTVFSAASGR